MLRPLLALLAAAGVATVLLPAPPASCPPDLPAGCACTESEGRLSISCVSAPLAAVLPKLASLPVDSLRLANCSVPVLDIDIDVERLRILELAHCGIGSVDPKALSSVAASLEELSLPDNRLTVVPRLGKLPRLVKLTLNRNLISDLPSGVFSFAPALTELRLEENRVCALQFNSLDETKSTLTLLDLSGNCISSLASTGAFRWAPVLTYLDLSSNKLTELSPLSLMNLPYLIEVRLSDNLLSRLLPLCINNAPELRYVYLQNNLLDSLASLPQLRKLDILDARANRLTKIPLLAGSPALRQLRLDANQISIVDPRALAAHPKLQLLSIQDNSISSLGAASFEGLSQLVVLLLSNNGLVTLDRASLAPLKSLQQLNLHNNSLSSLDSGVLTPLKQLTTIDVSKNRLQKLPKGVFEPLPKLFWADLSGNQLATFDKATFTKRISNLLLGDNPLFCDEALDWFVQWLVVNRVRIFLPNQPDVVCTAPKAYEGVTLRELMIKKEEEAVAIEGDCKRRERTADGIRIMREYLAAAKLVSKEFSARALVNNLLPGTSLMNGLVPAGQQVAGLGQIPGLGAFINNIPSLRNLPLGGAPGAGAAPMPAGSVRSMNSAIEQFAAPFVRFATGGQPQEALHKLLESIPKMIEAGGAAAAIDISNIQYEVFAHLLQGGAIPGISKETLDQIVANHMHKMAEVAAAIGRGEKPDDVEKYLPPLDRLPSELITNVMSGQSLPALTPEEMEPIKQYYLSTLFSRALSNDNDDISLEMLYNVTITSALSPSANGSDTAPSSVPILPVFPLTPQTLEMMRLLPAGYNISRIPMEIMDAITKGQVPDLRLLPADLQEHLKANTDKMLNMSAGGGSAASVQDMREVVEKLPSWDRPVETATYSPYDLNDVKTDLKAEEKAASQARMYRLMTAGVIGLLAIISLIVIVSMCVAQRRKILRGDLSEGSSIDNLRANAHSTPSPPSNQQRDSTHISQQRGIVHRRSPTQNI